MCAKASRTDEAPMLVELEKGALPSYAYFVFDLNFPHTPDRIIYRLFLLVVVVHVQVLQTDRARPM